MRNVARLARKGPGLARKPKSAGLRRRRCKRRPIPPDVRPVWSDRQAQSFARKAFRLAVEAKSVAGRDPGGLRARRMAGTPANLIGAPGFWTCAQGFFVGGRDFLFGVQAPTPCAQGSEACDRSVHGRVRRPCESGGRFTGRVAENRRTLPRAFHASRGHGPQACAAFGFGRRGRTAAHPGPVERVACTSAHQTASPASPSRIDCRIRGRSPARHSGTSYRTRYRSGPPSMPGLRSIGRGMHTKSVTYRAAADRVPSAPSIARAPPPGTARTGNPAPSTKSQKAAAACLRRGHRCHGGACA
jgi:hypothetical protein